MSSDKSSARASFFEVGDSTFKWESRTDIDLSLKLSPTLGH